MAIPTFNATENYDALTILRESQLNSLATSIETQFNTYTKTNFEQLGLDIFGASYVFNNDGVATRATALLDAAALLADNETVTGAWTFSGATTFSNTITSSSTFTSTGQMKAKVYLTTANQTITTAITTAISFNAESYDTGAMHDNGSSPSRLTIPVGGAGVYIFDGQVTFDNNNTGRRELYLYKNGSLVAKSKYFAPDATEDTVLNISYIDNSSAADYYELQVYQNSGGNLDIVNGSAATFFSAIKVC